MSLAQRCLHSIPLSNAVTLLATVELAIGAQAWVVDGANDPDGYMHCLYAAIAEADEGKASYFTGILAADCIRAIAAGDWNPAPGNLAFLESVAAAEHIFLPEMLAA